MTHHFIDEKDIEWLKNFKECDLTDEEARTLILWMYRHSRDP